MRETTIEKKLKTEVEKHGGKAYKFVSPGMSGVPDRIVLFPGGRLFFVELKAPSKNLEPLQVKRKKELEQLGFKVFKIDTFAGVNDFLKEVLQDGI